MLMSPNDKILTNVNAKKNMVTEFEMLRILNLNVVCNFNLYLNTFWMLKKCLKFKIKIVLN